MTSSSSVKVELISYTKFHKCPEDNLTDIVAYCARVSNPSNQTNKLSNDKLINYLIKHNHWSPFEMVNICLEINTTRDIARQILRHRSFSFQEFSQRYATPKLTFEIREPRFQDINNRQNSIDLDLSIDKNRDIKENWKFLQEKYIKFSKEIYEWAIQNNIAKEQARCVLPEGMTPSVLYMNGSLRSWIHYLEIRLNNDTQKEHREVAEKCKIEIEKIFPTITSFFNSKITINDDENEYCHVKYSIVKGVPYFGEIEKDKHINLQNNYHEQQEKETSQEKEKSKECIDD
jgi:thymidylate synthase (FAD)